MHFTRLVIHTLTRRPKYFISTNAAATTRKTLCCTPGFHRHTCFHSRQMATAPDSTSTSSTSTTEKKESTTKPKRVELSDTEWRAKLSTDEYRVLRKKGTEPPFSGDFISREWDTLKKGYFACRGCDAPLYLYKAKFSAHCGWPAFDKFVKGSIRTVVDTTHGMVRVEIVCAACDGHLGHVFAGESYKTRSDQRHCVNSLSIKYVDEELDEAVSEEDEFDKDTFRM